MKMTIAVCLFLTATACSQQNKPGNNAPNTLSARYDSVLASESEKASIKDSIHRKQQRDSFYAIKPIAVFHTDATGSAEQKLAAFLVDTSLVVKTPLHFSDTSFYTYNPKEEPVSITQICKNKQFSIKLFQPDLSGEKTSKLYINNHQVRAGIDIDTTLAHDFMRTAPEIDASDCYIMQLSNKRYLLIKSSVYKCTGIACKVSFYLLFDPERRKGIAIEQFNSILIAGYDKENKTPVFFDASADYNYLFECMLYKGKAYRITPSGKISPLVDKDNRQQQFTAYYKDEETIALLPPTSSL